MPRALPLPAPPLTDGRIALRPWREADIPAMVAALRDPEIPRWTFIPHPYGQREARDFLARAERDRNGGVGVALAITEGVDPGELLGAIGIEPVDRAAGLGEIGYWVAREYRGHGVATRAVRLLAGWAFGELGLRRLEILPFAGNAASERVAERAGFRRERLLRAHRLHPLSGQVRDMTLFALHAGGAARPEASG